MTPAAYGGIFTEDVTTTKELKTAAATFLVPAEIAHNRDDVAKYAEQLEYSVRRSSYSVVEKKAFRLQLTAYMRGYTPNLSDLIRRTRTAFGPGSSRTLLLLCLLDLLTS
jgi:hypothetical protein